jgi:rhodanese-related sulfurtransferase
MRLKTYIFSGLVFLLVFSCQEYKASPLTAAEFKAMMEASPDLQLIDVRTPGEVASGFIPDAVNIDFRDPDFQKTLDGLDRNKPIAVYCAVGQRSESAYNMLIEMKFREVYHLTGGTNAWRAENYELIIP